jgi:hypothetical protein
LEADVTVGFVGRDATNPDRQSQHNSLRCRLLAFRAGSRPRATRHECGPDQGRRATTDANESRTFRHGALLHDTQRFILPYNTNNRPVAVGHRGRGPLRETRMLTEATQHAEAEDRARRVLLDLYERRWTSLIGGSRSMC